MRDSHATVYTVQKIRYAFQTANRHAHEYISVRAPFTANSITGRTQPAMNDPGQLPREYQDAIMDAAELADDFYVVFSYDTPIAWFAFGAWNMPDVRYSVTTSKHQAIVRRAIEGGNREH